MLIDAIKNMTEEIRNSQNLFCVKQPEKLIVDLQDDWERWSLLKKLAANNMFPTNEFKKSDSIEQCYNNVKTKQGVDAFYYTLEFIGFKNRMIQDAINDLIERVLEA